MCLLATRISLSFLFAIIPHLLSSPVLACGPSCVACPCPWYDTPRVFVTVLAWGRNMWKQVACPRRGDPSSFLAVGWKQLLRYDSPSEFFFSSQYSKREKAQAATWCGFFVFSALSLNGLPHPQVVGLEPVLHRSQPTSFKSSSSLFLETRPGKRKDLFLIQVCTMDT